MKKFVLFAFLAAFIMAGIYGLGEYADHKLPAFNDRAEVYVYPGMTGGDVSDFLIGEGLARHPGRLARILAGTEPMAGHYTIEAGHTAVYLQRMLTHGWQTPVRLVLPNTMRLKWRIAQIISNQMLIDSATVSDALNDRDLLAAYGFTPENVFALFMPDSYEIYWTDSMEKVLNKQKQAYDAFWTAENDAKATEQGLSRMQVSILASIVKGESNYVPEFPAIAGVYLNRYHKGMKLQADPTIAFCYDYTLGRIYRKHLQVDSPYNTYLYAGLPPAPICVPTKECLLAVLNPDRHGYLYFCANSAMDGTHLFARTYQEHLKNARSFQSALTKLQRERAAAEKTGK